MPGITDRMLTKDLKELEANKSITHTVYDAFPPALEDAIPPHGESMDKVVMGAASVGRCA